MATIGTLYGIGVGPGDSELITVKGLRKLQSANVVAFPAGTNNRPGIAEQIVQPWLRSYQIRLPLQFPYVQDAIALQTAWDAAAAQVWSHLQQGQSVAFACEGDVSFYSTFTYLAQSLKAAHPEAPVLTIPGICSPMAAAAALGIPLTTQAQQLAILPALYDANALTAALTWADVIVLMKVSSVYSQVWHILKQHQLLSHSYVIERATQSQQKIYRDLTHHPNLKLPYFSLMVIQTNPASAS
jgi:precorrin-2/cobalt-factor-2 C20-methyltransferase